MDDNQAIPHIHVVPVDDAIEHENSEDCICGPEVEFRPGSVSFIHHYLQHDPVKEQAIKDEIAQRKAQ